MYNHPSYYNNQYYNGGQPEYPPGYSFHPPPYAASSSSAPDGSYMYAPPPAPPSHHPLAHSGAIPGRHHYQPMGHPAVAAALAVSGTGGGTSDSDVCSSSGSIFSHSTNSSNGQSFTPHASSSSSISSMPSRPPTDSISSSASGTKMFNPFINVDARQFFPNHKMLVDYMNMHRERQLAQNQKYKDDIERGAKSAAPVAPSTASEPVADHERKEEEDASNSESKREDLNVLANLATQFFDKSYTNPPTTTTDSSLRLASITRRHKKNRVSRKNERIFACEHPGCDYQTDRSSNLLTHTRQHTGERPFICTHEGCFYRASHRSNLKVHEKVHGVSRPVKSKSEDELYHDEPVDVEGRADKGLPETDV